MTRNGRGPAGVRPGSVPKGNTRRPPGASRTGVRMFFAPAAGEQPALPRAPERPPRPRRRRAGPEVCRRTSTRSPRPSVARAAPPASWPSSSPRPRPPPASRRRPSARQDPPPAPMSSRSGGATGASAGAPTSRPTSPARALSRHGQPAWRPPGAEDLHGAREAPVAARHPRTSSASSRTSTGSSSRGPRLEDRRSQSLDLQPRPPGPLALTTRSTSTTTLASVRDDRPGLDSCLRALRQGRRARGLEDRPPRPQPLVNTVQDRSARRVARGCSPVGSTCRIDGRSRRAHCR